MSGHDHDHDHDDVDLLRWPDALGPEWTCEAAAAAPGHESTLIIRRAGSQVATVDVMRILDSEFAATYPSGLRDRLLLPDAGAPAEAIQLASESVMDADPACRRLVMACAEDDLETIGIAETAGYRFVVEVDLHRGSFALLTAEPAWVLEESRNIDEVPTV
ncbi:hypothetical protein Q2T94_11710 [Paeniglutamicibacter sulfureus]|uniref:hypothetical protein n=1 Tax=Paeniglutamicibacter sulfureus TaxID=43666 RepID=UPI002666E0DA|nr:hypothetical protein [Paeniglutamicibacter sulfureus]MDO2934971.1 hypothetical protein [Paeniglutamicibacter sulfureus]